MRGNRYDKGGTILDRMKKKVEHIDTINETEKKSRGRQLIVVNNKFVMRSVNYDPSLPEKLIKYFNEPAYKIVKGEKKACDYPTIQGFRAKHGITVGKWNQWVKEYEELAHAREIINEFKYDKLITNGLNGKYNAQIVKLVAQNELGMSDKVETKVVDSVSDEQRKSMVMEYLNDLRSGEVLDVTTVDDNKGDI